MLMSIVILSYNRPKQIKRILDNFVDAKANDYNIIIKDDRSPKFSEIKEIVDDYADKLNVEVKLYSNSKNMGYDLNLIDAFNIAESEYVFLLSDDDYLNGNAMDGVVNTLKKNNECVYFTPYAAGDVINRSLIESYDFNKFTDVIYNSILFSGLIIKRMSVLELSLNLEFLKNCIYSQVFITSLIVFKHQSFGVMPKGILYLGGDGENFFGKNPSAENKDLLSDRKKITADLNYQFFLLKVIDEIAKQTSQEIKKQFNKEYKKRLIGYGLRARSQGLSDYLEFIRTCFSGPIETKNIPIFIFLIIFMMPSALSKFVYDFGLKALRKSG